MILFFDVIYESKTVMNQQKEQLIHFRDEDEYEQELSITNEMC